MDESKAIAPEGKAGAGIFMNGMTPNASVTNTSPRQRRTLIHSYRAACAFPIYFCETTIQAETYVRQARREPAVAALFITRDRYSQTTKKNSVTLRSAGPLPLKVRPTVATSGKP